MDNHHLEKFIDEIKEHESYRDEVYLDSRGNPTCGWGHHLAIGSKIPLQVSEIFLEGDIANAISDFYKLDRKIQDKLNPVGRRVICNMIFNMGLLKVLEFKKMFKAIKKEDWEEAGTQLLDSQYAQQVGYRAFYLRNLLVKGENP